ncbi:phosphatidate cytidylyltransferase [Alkalibacillus salilacus]|uniref:Phosphatidate cytidylyltransferase n=1 Tax=Alkalibacillus salilacus TaxID=284582 RepID=A0ABT9VDN8_9BACI|nr:phosphatidate cytidylyltransferase [Alkalibacillus salilacus]MDQ0159059.1 phosphatidate cytidylyltransferase [Alkalibacillus salilacus]
MKQRVLTAVIGLIIFLPFIVYGDWPFILIIGLLATVGLSELFQMKNITLFSFPAILSFVLLWIGFIDLFIYSFLANLPINLTELALLAAFTLLAFIVLVKNHVTYSDMAFILLSFIYVGVGFATVIETRLLGLDYILFAFLIIWFTDTGAYLIGRSIGKRKLWPEISPKKTIAGFNGGIASAVLIALIFEMINPLYDNIVIVIMIAILGSILAQLGDLVESALKRTYGVKDSGRILPGHGGILDRFDSLIFMLPFLHFLQFL